MAVTVTAGLQIKEESVIFISPSNPKTLSDPVHRYTNRRALSDPIYGQTNPRTLCDPVHGQTNRINVGVWIGLRPIQGRKIKHKDIIQLLHQFPTRSNK